MRFDKARPVEWEVAPAAAKFRLPVPRIKPHVPFQFGFTLASSATGVLSLLGVIVLQGRVAQLELNFAGGITNSLLPCTRALLPSCSAKQGSCNQACCPMGYQCTLDPKLGLYCQDRENLCGTLPFCTDVADVVGTCSSANCQTLRMLKTMLGIVYVLAALGVALDALDLLLCVAFADNVLLKSVTNLVAFCVKILAFCCLVGVGTQGFLAAWSQAKCFNADGQVFLASAYVMFAVSAGVLLLSSVFSLVLVPVSAMFGGRITDQPMYQLKVLDLGG